MIKMFALEYTEDGEHYWHFSPTKERLEEKLQEWKDKVQSMTRYTNKNLGVYRTYVIF